jgi:hypothetical protein
VHACRHRELYGRGIPAFKLGDRELSLLHFNLYNARSLREVKRTIKWGAATVPAKTNAERGVRGAYFGFKFNKAGCNNKKCSREHACLNYNAKDHPNQCLPHGKKQLTMGHPYVQR